MVFWALGLLLAAAVFVWTAVVEPRSFRISRHAVRLKKPLARSLHLLHLSDIHFAFSDPLLNRFFDRLAREPCDFIFVTGDVIDCEEGIPACVENLSKLKPSQGMYVVFGNHDYYEYRGIDVLFRSFRAEGHPKTRQRIELLHRALVEAGIRVLRNETAEVSFFGTPLLIHGLDDPTTGREDMGKTLTQCDPGKINILLTHTINVFAAIGEDQMDLALAGHSHGGQIRLPLIGPIVTHTYIGRRYVSGVMPLKGAICCVSRGVNASRFFKWRLLCPPEAIILEVRGAQ